MAKKPATRMYRDFRDLLSELNANKVRYLVVGAYAVGYHAQPRVTKDLDLLIGADAENARALWKALIAFQAPVSGMKPADLVEPGTFFRFGRPPIAVDILTAIDGIAFEDAWKGRVQRVVDLETGLEVALISADDLIKAKLASGRPQDLADVDALRKARKALERCKAPPKRRAKAPSRKRPRKT